MSALYWWSMSRIIFTKYACPQCRQLVQVTRMSSMFIFDVVEWSDGRDELLTW